MWVLWFIQFSILIVRKFSKVKEKIMDLLFELYRLLGRRLLDSSRDMPHLDTRRFAIFSSDTQSLRYITIIELQSPGKQVR